LYYNVTGMKSKKSDFYVDLSKTKASIFCFSESMYVSSNFKNKFFTDYEIRSIPARKNPRGRPSGGLIYGWKFNLKDDIYIIKESETSVFLHFKVTNTNLLIVFFYISADSSYFAKLKALMEEVSQFSASFKPIILIGDANAHVGSLNATAAPQRSSKDTRIDAKGRTLLSHVDEVELEIGNGALAGDRHGEVTFISSANGGSSVIDLLLFTPSSSCLIQKFQVLNISHSDHFPILTTLNLNLQIPPPQKE